MNIKKIVLCCMVLITYTISASVPNSVTGTIPISSDFNNPYGIVITSDSSKAYVCNYAENSISIIDIATNTLISMVQDSNGYIYSPQFIVISADGNTAYVTCNSNIPNGPSGNLGGVAIIDLNAENSTYNTVTGLVTDLSPSTFNAPYGIAINPHAVSGVYYAYVTNYNGNTVSIIDTSTNTVTAIVRDPDSLIQNPVGIAIAPYAVDGTYYAYVCDYNGSSSVSIIDLTLSNTTYNNVIGSVDFGTVGDSVYNATWVAFAPHAIDGLYYAYMADIYANLVFVIEVNTNAATDMIGLNNEFYSPNYITIDSTGTYAYVTDQSSRSTVTVINLSNNEIATQINSTINVPNACALSPDGQYLYVSNSSIGSNNVTQITLANDNGSTVLVSSPVAIAMTLDGATAYVGSVNNEGNLYGFISIIDCITNSLTGVVNDPDNVLAPVAIVINKDGSTAYTANTSLNNVGIVDLTNNLVTDSIASISSPFCLALTQDGSKLYVGGSSGITVVDTTTNNIISIIEDTSVINSIAMQSITNYAYAVVNNATIVVIDTTTDTLTNIIINDLQYLLNNPLSITISPDGHTAYVINSGNQVVSIDLITNTVIGFIADSSGTVQDALSIIFSPDGSTAYVMNTNPNIYTTPYSYNISIIDTLYAKVIGTITDASLQTPCGMAITQNSTTGYVINNSGNSISIVAI